MYRKSSPPVDPKDPVKVIAFKDRVYSFFYYTSGVWKGDLKFIWSLLLITAGVVFTFSIAYHYAHKHDQKQLQLKMAAPCSTFEDSLLMNVPAHCLRELMQPKK